MVLALGVIAVVMLVLAGDLVANRAGQALAARRERRRRDAAFGYDPGRERRAEQRARELLKSCVNAEEWAMYRDLGFIRLWGAVPSRPDAEAPYAYLIYPHKPIVAYVPQTGRLLNEYCVAFADEARPYGSSRLPASDDVLAKWMALRGDERRVVATANMHFPGRQLDPERVRRDLWRLRQWERARLRAAAREASTAGGRGERPDTVPAP